MCFVPTLKGCSKDKHVKVRSLYNQSIGDGACHCRIQRDSESQNVLVLWALVIILIERKKVKQAC